MASAADSKEPSTEPEKDIWKKAEQQFTSYEYSPRPLPPNQANWLAASAARNSLTLVRTSPMRASNVCAGTIATKICAKIISSTMLFLNPPPAPPEYFSLLCAARPSRQLNFFLISAVGLTESLYAKQGISRLQERMGMSPKEFRLLDEVD
jgi:hypothetical protein